MSILIKGMEMPKDGETIGVYIDGRGKVYEWLRDAIRDEHSIADAIPVPPHGRLIDADALLGDLPVEYPSIVYAIETAPTIIPADKESGE